MVLYQLLIDCNGNRVNIEVVNVSGGMTNFFYNIQYGIVSFPARENIIFFLSLPLPILKPSNFLLSQ